MKSPTRPKEAGSGALATEVSASMPSKDAMPFVPFNVNTMPTVSYCVAGGLNVMDAFGEAVVTVSEYGFEDGATHE